MAKYMSGVAFANRFASYFSAKHLLKNYCMLIHRALLKYGYSNFTLEILEYCDPENIIAREQFYLDLFKPDYNTLKKAGSSLGYTHSEEAKVKISKAGIGNTNRLGKTHTEETLARLSEGRKGKAKPDGAGRPNKKIEVVDLLDEKNPTTTVYNSIREAARALNIDKSVIIKYFARKQKIPYKGRYKLKLL